MASTPRPLSPIQKRVLALLSASPKPLSAYDLLALLRGDGVNAPPTVYRALERLMRDGLAHRIESLNAFVACSQPHHLAIASFAICDHCGAVAELVDQDLGELLGALGRRDGFHAERMTVELRGHCAACAHKSHADGAPHAH